MTEKHADDELDEFGRRLPKTHSGDEGLHEVLDGLPDFIRTYLPDTTLTFLYAAYARRPGGNPEDLIGGKFFDFPPADEASRVSHYLQSFSPQNPVQNYRSEIEIADGVIREFERVDHAEFDEHGNLAGFRATGRDMTEPALSEAAVRESEARFRARFKNMPIPTYCWWRTDDDFVLIDHNDAAERGAALTQRLLSFSRLQPLNPEPVDLNALIERMAALFRPVLSAAIETENNLARKIASVSRA